MDTVDKATRSRIMSSVGQRDTGPEMRIRCSLHRLGFRYRLHVRELPGTPDLTFPRFKAVIFVHGCFWHAHGCHLSKVPQTRSQFWEDKFNANRCRDEKNTQSLRVAGWRVLVVWQCAIKSKPQTEFDKLVSEIAVWLLSSSGYGEFGALQG